MYTESAMVRGIRKRRMTLPAGMEDTPKSRSIRLALIDRVHSARHRAGLEGKQDAEFEGMSNGQILGLERDALRRLYPD
ncbi:MAG: hypothetical protein IT435_15955 [Phycisphaerales bacterium]|nr:hypothetical protein [Phycisphaerales bacterium]